MIFCVYHWYGNFNLFLAKLLKEFYTGIIITGVNLYGKAFMQGFCFLKYFYYYTLAHGDLFIEWFKADPCMLENCFEGTWYRTPVANSGTVSPWRVMVNLELAWYSWGIVSRLIIVRFVLTLVIRGSSICACFVALCCACFVALRCACFVALPRLVIYPRGLCVHACFVALPRLVIFPRGLCVHACHFVLWKVL